MTAAPTLSDILANLTAKKRPTKQPPLSRGLILAYTPGACNETEPGVFRLTLSRRGTWPSEQEIEIVKRELWAVLIKNGRIPERIDLEPHLKAGGNIHYHVLFWREGVQARLL